jgi:mannose-6-phosphate isomerase-like protein (cupin superfamily)
MYLINKIYERNDLLSELDQRRYSIDFITTSSIQAGIIRLHAGRNDIQEPHSVDEVYYIIEGSGFIKLDDKDHAIKQGTSIFVPARTEHKFHGNNQDLVIFYAFGINLHKNIHYG